jgi:uncharacterized protein (TIGR03083 family)
VSAEIRTFESWVAPIADRYQSKRREVVAVARSVPDDAWDKPSPVEGWSFRDVLAHLAEGDVSVRHTIQTVIDGGNLDFRAWNNGREERIARALRRGAPLAIPELISRALEDGEQTNRLLSKLTGAHEEVLVITSRTDPRPMSLRAYLSAYEHDEEHLEHLRPAITVGSPS